MRADRSVPRCTSTNLFVALRKTNLFPPRTLCGGYGQVVSGHLRLTVLQAIPV